MWVNPQFYLLYSQLLNKFLTEKFIFLHWFVQVNRQKATVLHKKIKFSIKDFFGKCDQICRKQWIWSHLLKKSLMETSFIVQCEEEYSLFFEKLCCFFIHIFRKSIWNLQIFHRSVFRCKVLRPFVFYLSDVQSTVLISSSLQGENVLIW